MPAEWRCRPKHPPLQPNVGTKLALLGDKRSAEVIHSINPEVIEKSGSEKNAQKIGVTAYDQIGSPFVTNYTDAALVSFPISFPLRRIGLQLP